MNSSCQVRLVIVLRTADDKPDDGLMRVPHNGTSLGFPHCEFYGTGPPILRQPGQGQQASKRLEGHLSLSLHCP